MGTCLAVACALCEVRRPVCSQVFHKFSVNLCMFGPSSQPCSFSNPVFLGPKPFWGPFRYSISSEAREERRGEGRQERFILKNWLT